MKRNLLWIALWLIVSVSFFLFSQHYFALFLLIVFSIFLLNASVVLVLKKFVTVTLIAPTTVVKGQENEVCIRIQNDAPIGIGRLVAQIQYEHTMTHNKKTVPFLTAVPRKGEVQLRIPIEATMCGQLRLTLSHVTLEDAFAFFSTKVFVNVNQLYNVLPIGFPLHIALPNEATVIAAGQMAGASAATYSDEIADLKPYIIGDNVKNIHWKLSSKLGELYLKQMEKVADERFLLALSMYGIQHAEEYDSTLEVFYAMSTALLNAGKSFEVMYNKNGEIHTTKLQNEQQIIDMLEQYIADASHTTQSLQHRLGQQLPYTAVLVVATAQEQLEKFDHQYVFQYSGHKQMDNLRYFNEKNLDQWHEVTLI